jgi:hypothetical protein
MANAIQTLQTCSGDSLSEPVLENGRTYLVI